MVELVDTLDLGSNEIFRTGSSPVSSMLCVFGEGGYSLMVERLLCM